MSTHSGMFISTTFLPLLIFSLTFISQVCMDVALSERTGRVFLSSWSLLWRREWRKGGRVKPINTKNLTISAWQDNKTVTVAATNCDPTVCEQVSRKQKDGTSIPVKCPQSVVLYNTWAEWTIMISLEDTIMYAWSVESRVSHRCSDTINNRTLSIIGRSPQEAGGSSQSHSGTGGYHHSTVV